MQNLNVNVTIHNLSCRMSVRGCRRPEDGTTRASISIPSLWDCTTWREKPSGPLPGLVALGGRDGSRDSPWGPLRAGFGSQSPSHPPPMGPWVVRAGLWDLETSPAGVSLGQRLTAAECKWGCCLWAGGYSRTYKDHSWYFKHPSENNATNFPVEPDIFCH